MSLDKSLPEIYNMISDYRYGQFNLLEKQIKGFYFKDSGRLIINNYYRHGNSNGVGTCSEHRLDATKAIEKRFKGYYVMWALGNDPLFFTSDSSHHSFLFVSEDDFFTENSLNVNDYYSNGEIISNFLNTNPVLVDPSFKFISRWKDINLNFKYKVSSIFNPVYRIPDELVMISSDVYPLFEEDGKMVNISMHDSESNHSNFNYHNSIPSISNYNNMFSLKLAFFKTLSEIKYFGLEQVLSSNEFSKTAKKFAEAFRNADIYSS